MMSRIPPDKKSKESSTRILKKEETARDNGVDKPASKSPARSAADYISDDPDLESMQSAAQKCKGCDLYKNAVQAVFGEGNAKAKIIFVGEQPGDIEDREGHPFVGPAGKLLHKALAAAGIKESDVYLTNAVKHFKYEWKGKKRLHSKPRRIEVMACMPWLEAEIATIKPDVIVCLGATAAQAFLGTKFRLTQHRAEPMPTHLARYIVATVHPSSILRAPDAESRHAAMDEFIDDLRTIEKLLHQ